MTLKNTDCQVGRHFFSCFQCLLRGARAFPLLEMPDSNFRPLQDVSEDDAALEYEGRPNHPVVRTRFLHFMCDGSL